MVRATKHFKNKFGDLSFGQLIWSYRKSEEMSQSELADLMDVSKQYISQLERGDRLASVEKAVLFAKVFEMNPETFVLKALQDQVIKAGLNMKIKSA